MRLYIRVGDDVLGQGVIVFDLFGRFLLQPERLPPRRWWWDGGSWWKGRVAEDAMEAPWMRIRKITAETSVYSPASSTAIDRRC